MSVATKAEIRQMTRKELVEYLEGVRGFQCYASETEAELRKCALSDVADEHSTQRHLHDR